MGGRDPCMRVLDFPLLADENLHPGVVKGLRTRGRDIRTVHDEGLQGGEDLAILRRASHQGRVVLTHDGDFGILAIRGGAPVVGIIYLRPGHISPMVTLEMLDAVNTELAEVKPPFLAVAQRARRTIRVRIRQLDL